MKIKKYLQEKENDPASRLKSYSALAAAFLAAASQAEAQIVYRDVNPDAIVHNGLYTVDMDGDGFGDFVINQFSVSGSQNYRIAGLTATSSRLSNRVIANGASINQYFVNRLPAGAVIGPSVTGFKTMQQAVSNVFPMASNLYNNSFGYWRGSQSGYIGVEFKTNGNIYYGWIDCYVARHADTVIVRGLAYNSVPNDSIHAGETGVMTGTDAAASGANHFGNIFPNPSRHDFAFIEADLNQAGEVRTEIMNAVGTIMRGEDHPLSSGKNRLRINTEGIANGFYFLRISSGDKTYFRNLVIARP